MPWDNNLAGVHRNIAADPADRIHVLAGPGTGKTFAMMRRIARLLEEGVAPERILAVSFTRTAARDLREQLQLLGIAGADQVLATTLHSLSFSILAREAVFEATRRVPRMLLSYEVEQLVNDLAPLFGGKVPVRENIEAYEAAWARLQRDEAGPPRDEDSARFEAALLNWLRYHQCALVGELVPLTLIYIRQNPAAPVLPVFDHVLVDEFQDLNRADQALVELLAQHGTLTVIGDVNQSIYSFRYANPEGILDFPNAGPTTSCHLISECRRCPPNIVEMGRALIQHNLPAGQRVDFTADSNRPDATVFVVQHPTLEDEFESTADFVANYLRAHPEVPPGQVLVLATRRVIANGIKRALINRRLNALSYFSEDQVETDAAAEGFCLLTLLVVPNDRAALRAWLGLRHDKGYAPAYARVRTYAEEHELEVFQVLELLESGATRLPYTSGIIARFTTLRGRLAALAGLTGLDLVNALWDATDEDAFDIRLAAQNCAVNNAEPAALREALFREITQPVIPDSQGDIVRIMSLHKSKGLTAKVVLVCGCVAGALPTVKGFDPVLTARQIQEQRRLFYVAITRASNTLVVSSSVGMSEAQAQQSGIAFQRTFIRGQGRIARTSPSPFLGELGNHAPAAISTELWRRDPRFNG